MQHFRRVLVRIGRHRRQIGEAFLHNFALDRGAGRGVQPGDDVGRRAFGGEQAVPALRLEFGQAGFCRGAGAAPR